MAFGVQYSAYFLRKVKKLPSQQQEEVFERVEFFEELDNHQRLKVHKFKGRPAECYAFSVNYSDRIIFQYENKQLVTLLDIGDHDIYKRYM